MYSRPTGNSDRGISIPQNYSGNAFGGTHDIIPTVENEIQEESGEKASAPTCACREKESILPKNLFPINMGSEELIILGIALLVFQSNKNDGILPLLLAILFLG